MYEKLEIDFAGRKLTLETGRLAKQAHGSVLATYGDTVVLATAVSQYEARPNMDFLPLTVDYVEKTFAAGKIPGGFFKREGRASEKEVLTSRLIDRAMRPLPQGLRSRNSNHHDRALRRSRQRSRHAFVDRGVGCGARFRHSAQRPGGFRQDGPGRWENLVNPTHTELEGSDVSLVVAASPESIMMLEGGAQIVDEEVILEALFTAHEAMQPLFAMQEELRRRAGKTKREFAVKERDTALLAAVEKSIGDGIEKALATKGKKERAAAVYAVSDKVVAELAEKFPDRSKEIIDACDYLVRTRVRLAILDDDKRIDNRKSTDIRPLSAEVQVLPRTHGSAVFTRGETQALATVTLGTSSDEQNIDALLGERFKKFLLHYNFPPFSTGEVEVSARTVASRSRPRRTRRTRAIADSSRRSRLPVHDSCRLRRARSNGSSSMATVCGGSLALMDAGVPRITGRGHRDGSRKRGRQGPRADRHPRRRGPSRRHGLQGCRHQGGITAIQMDNKAGGVSKEIMRQALHQARDARLFILGVMEKAMPEPRKDVSSYAPRIVTLHIKPDKIREVIGPGGKVIRGLVEQTGCKIDIEDDGTVLIASADGTAMEKAISMIQAITAEPEVGKIYHGTSARSSSSAPSSKSCPAPTACSTSRRSPTSVFAASRTCCTKATRSA